MLGSLGLELQVVLRYPMDAGNQTQGPLDEGPTVLLLLATEPSLQPHVYILDANAAFKKICLVFFLFAWVVYLLVCFETGSC